jgi:hypothetical protein
VLLDSIGRSDGSRKSASEQLFKTDITDGILGNFKIDENGDTTLGTVTFFKISGGQSAVVKLITPDLSLIS